ncbi:stage II sporulation protein M [Bacillus cereus]|uniref:Stage II sporulation protein M n=1 Tax=Bacillus cereus TaxID=1396 RepID=A0AAW4R4E4_BACCE|nr:stage II sporulation protein M [Bacillus cereus]MBY0040883.1 stage II sporulation protein M [Bacillus cereus]
MKQQQHSVFMQLKLKLNNKSIFLLFIFSLIIGVIYGSFFLEKTTVNWKEINNFEAFITILSRNITCSLILIISTFFGSLLLKFFFVGNGLVLGLTISKFQSLNYLILVIPHGIIEIPSFLYLGYILIKAIDQNKFTFKTLKGVGLSIILLIIAALIESYVTPNLIQFIIN